MKTENTNQQRPEIRIRKHTISASCNGECEYNRVFFAVSFFHKDKQDFGGLMNDLSLTDLTLLHIELGKYLNKENEKI